MGTATGVYSARTNHRLRIETQLASQNVAGNYSTINFQIYSEKTAASTSYYLTAGGGGSFNIGGNTGGLPAWLYDFRSATSYTRATGSVNVGHNPDGTGSYGFSASDTAPGSLGSASASGSEGLPTIPRASNSTLSPQPVDAGGILTINTNRASASFTHTISYYFGAASGVIASGVTDSVAWSVPLSLLNQIPNSLSGVGYIHTATYNGGTLIGETDVSLTVTVPSSIIPDFTTITNSEAVTSVSTIVGAYVQNLTKLALAITGAIGAYGSTISSYKIDVAGQTINTASGTTPVAIGTAGTITITGTVTDSRGRTIAKSVNITILAYAPPVIDGALFKIQRSNSSGTVDESGTYIRTTLKASVSSLVVGTQKNTLTYKIYTKVRDAATWNLQKTVALSAGTIAFNSFDVVGAAYVLTSSYDVQITVEDKFSVVPIAGVLATGNIFMHWGTGLGVGKFWERGEIDAKGFIYQNAGDPVVSPTNFDSLFPTLASVPQNISTTGDFNTVTNTGWTMGYQVANAPLINRWYITFTLRHNSIWCVQNAYEFTSNPVVHWRRQQLNGTWLPWYQVYSTADEIRTLMDGLGAKYMAQVVLRPLNSWILYSDNIISDSNQQFGESINSGNAGMTGLSAEAGNLHATITSTGIVQLQGLLYRSSAPATGTTILQLPVGMRPARTQVYQGFAAAGWSSIAVQADGNVVFSGAAGGAVGYVSLAHIRFRASGYGTFTALTLIAPWVAHTVAAYSGETGSFVHTAGYTTDADGVVIFEGIITNNAATAGTTNIAQPSGLPALLGSHQQIWGSGTQTYARYGASGGGVGSGNIINTSPAQAINSAISLSQMMILLLTSSTTSWKTFPMANAWGTYNGVDWATPQIAKTPDGFVMMKGLLSAGTMGTMMTIVGPGWRPRYNVILATVSNAALARLDVSPLANGPGTWTGSVISNTGSNLWYSFDGQSWPAYR